MKLLIGVLLVFFIGCGVEDSNHKGEIPSLDLKALKPIQVPLNVIAKGEQSSLSLLSIQSYKVAVEGCVSGKRVEVDQSHNFVPLYPTDQNCRAKLTEITLNDVRFTMSTERPFFDYSQGEEAFFVFEEGNKTHYLVIRIDQQLSSPIKVNDEISFSYREIREEVVNENHNLSVPFQQFVGGVNSPAFELKEIVLGQIDELGYGRFQFKFACKTPQEEVEGSFFCGGQNLSKIRYGLSGPDKAESYSPEILQQISNSEQSNRVKVPNDVIFSDNQENGGFSTKSGRKALLGPGVLEEHPEMLLVIESDQKSYQYFRIHLQF